MEKFPVTTTLEDAADAIMKSSFAIYQVPATTAERMREAWQEAARILNHPPSVETKQWTRIVNGHLHGYNEPSPAKRLFRAFPSSKLQPWPTELFRQVSTDLASDLHDVLMECYKCLCRADCSDRVIEDRPSMKVECHSTSSTPSKRRRLTHIEAQHCPLDYFFYHNRNTNNTNCSEHVDRGLLIAVCLTDVPGLEILMEDVESKTTTWLCPEISIHNSNLYREIPASSVSDLICIMAGGQLSQILTNEVPACVHRVRNKLKRARLSISYELRLPF